MSKLNAFCKIESLRKHREGFDGDKVERNSLTPNTFFVFVLPNKK